NMLQCNLGISETQASDIFRWFPVGAAILTPFLGYFLDRKGKGASMLILGAILMIVCHLTFAFVVPATQSELITYSAIVVLGVSFSLVPAALWPSVPKIMDKRFLGSAYSLIFWVQNIGLAFVPIIIGKVITWSNPGVTDPLQYDYTMPMCCFAALGVLALIFGIILKSMNAVYHYGLEDPNIKADFEDVRIDGEA
ncbi:MFS transporter, partial [uncultured Duncaniella sp.]